MKTLVAKVNEIKNQSRPQIDKRLNVSKCNSDYISSQSKAIANSSVIEYVQVTASQAIVVTENDVWIRSANNGSIFAPEVSARKIDKLDSSKRLLDTAIILGKRAAHVAQQQPRMTIDKWIWSLVSQYHLTHPTPELMREAAQRFSAAGRDLLAEWAREKAQEEAGHDRLALKDLESLGYQAQALVDAYCPDFSRVMIDYFARSVNNPDPIKVVGYVYALERGSLAVKENHIQAVQQMLPTGVNATRCLRVHSSVGSDAEHVDEALEMIAQLSTTERKQVAIACYETARLYFSTTEGDFPTARELKQRLQPFQQQYSLA